MTMPTVRPGRHAMERPRHQLFSPLEYCSHRLMGTKPSIWGMTSNALASRVQLFKSDIWFSNKGVSRVQPVSTSQ
jgi:hypothetical protein